MSLFWIILAIVSNDPGEALCSFPEDALDVCESEVIPDFGTGVQNRLVALELSILHLLLWPAKQPKVARIYVSRIRWVWSPFNAPVDKFLGDLVIIITHRIIHVDLKRLGSACSVNFASFHCATLENIKTRSHPDGKKIFTRVFCPEISCGILGMMLSLEPANIESEQEEY
jgi:hypothetical protein